MAAVTLHPASDREPARLSMRGDLTIYEAAQTQQALLELLPGASGPWHLDLSGLDEIDSAGIQLLLALQQSLAQGAAVSALPEQAGALVELLRLDALRPAGEV